MTVHDICNSKLFILYILNCIHMYSFLYLYYLYIYYYHLYLFSFFFFNDTATTEIYTLSLHDALPILRDIKSKNVYSRVNSKATTQWRKTESANGVHLEGVASDNRSS